MPEAQIHFFLRSRTVNNVCVLGGTRDGRSLHSRRDRDCDGGLGPSGGHLGSGHDRLHDSRQERGGLGEILLKDKKKPSSSRDLSNSLTTCSRLTAFVCFFHSGMVNATSVLR